MRPIETRMRNLITTTLLLLSICSLTAQIEIQKIKYKGDSVYVWPFELRRAYNDMPKIIPVADSLPTGNYIVFHNNNMNWLQKLFTRHEVSARFSVVNGQINSWVKFFNKDGNVKAEGEMNNYLKNGPWMLYYEDGSKKRIITYRENKKHGPYTSFYDPEIGKKNVVSVRSNYKDGSLHGLIKDFYPNGALRYEGFYDSDQVYNELDELKLERDLPNDLLYREVKSYKFHTGNDTLFRNKTNGWIFYELGDKIADPYMTYPANLIRYRYNTARSKDNWKNLKFYAPQGELIYHIEVVDSALKVHKCAYSNGQPFRTIETKGDTVFKTYFNKDGSVGPHEVYLWKDFTSEDSTTSKSLSLIRKEYRFTDRKFTTSGKIIKYKNQGIQTLENGLQIIEKRIRDGVVTGVLYITPHEDTYKGRRQTQKFFDQDLGTGAVVKFEYYPEDTFNYTYKYTISQNQPDIKMEFYGNSKNHKKLKAFNPARFYSIDALYTTGKARRYGYYRGYNNNYFCFDSIIVYVEGQRFTGPMATRRYDKRNPNFEWWKRKFVMSGDTLIKNTKAYTYWRSKRKIYDYDTEFNGNFVNGFIEGNWRGKNYTKGLLNDTAKSYRTRKLYKHWWQRNKRVKTLWYEDITKNGVPERNISYKFKNKRISKVIDGKKKKKRIKYHGVEKIEHFNGDSLKAFFLAPGNFIDEHEDSIWNLKKRHLVEVGYPTDTAKLTPKMLDAVKTYYRGQAHGTHLEYMEGIVQKSTQFHLGQKNGKNFELFYNLADTNYAVTYKNGLADGFFFEKRSPDKFKIKAQFKDGVPYGEMFLYNKMGDMNMKIRIDSAHIKSYKWERIQELRKEQIESLKKPYEQPKSRHWYRRSYRRTYNSIDKKADIFDIYDDPYSTYFRLDSAFITTYHANGNVFSKGKMIDDKRSGQWIFNNEMGRKIREVNYVEKEDTVSNTTTYGSFTEYFDGGQLKGTGVLLNMNYEYDCETGLHKADEDVLYSNYKDLNGNYIVKDGNGYLKTYHEGDTILKQEGAIKNGQREGKWISYDPDGLKKAVGKYVNGKKEGIWVTGDLGGINFIDGACFVNEQVFLQTKMRQKNNLNFIMIHYKDGEVLSRNRFYYNAKGIFKK